MKRLLLYFVIALAAFFVGVCADTSANRAVDSLSPTEGELKDILINYDKADKVCLCSRPDAWTMENCDCGGPEPRIIKERREPPSHSPPPPRKIPLPFTTSFPTLS